VLYANIVERTIERAASYKINMRLRPVLYDFM